jgi:prepilin-type N-terminal cleavage/methylation domain-containing protein
MAVDRRRQGERGFSLIELMVTSLILGVLLTYLFDSFTSYHRSGEVVAQVTESQQNSRAIAGLIEHDIRHAGMMVPGAGAFCGVDSTTASDTIYFSDADAIDPTSSNSNDMGSPFAGSVIGSGTSTIDVDLSIESPDNFAYDTNGDGVADSDFRVGGGVILIDQGNPTRGAACGSVTAVDLTNSRITFSLVSPILGASPGAGVNLVAIPAHEYRINNLTLMRNNMALAMGVEDLQAAYFFDDNDDNVVDAGEYRGDGVGADFLANALNAEDAREIRVTFVTRTRNEDAHFPGGRFQSAENRAVINTVDGYRRRVHTSTIELRNLLIRQSSI